MTKDVHVYPSSTLPEGSFLPGVGEDGAEVSAELAAEWLAAGLARKTAPPVPPDEQPVAPAEE